MNRTRSYLQVAGKLTGIIVFALALSACSSGSTTVVKAPTEKFTGASIVVVEQRTEAPVTQNIRNNFKLMLNDKLYEKDGFAKGGDLKLTFAFIRYEPGNRAARYALGGLGGVGEGVMKIQVTFENASGRKIAEIVSEGKIKAGLAGGSIDKALDRAAEEIAEYAKSNFRS